MVVNGKIEIGLGLAIVAWGVVAAFNDQFVLAAVLGVAGLGLVVYGANRTKGAR